MIKLIRSSAFSFFAPATRAVLCFSLALGFAAAACGGSDGSGSAARPAGSQCVDIPDTTPLSFVRTSGDCDELPDATILDFDDADCTPSAVEATCAYSVACDGANEDGSGMTSGSLTLSYAAKPVRGTYSVTAKDVDGAEVCSATYSVTSN